MPVPPPLTPEQRREALQKAAAARRARAEAKDKLRIGSLSLAELLEQVSSDQPDGSVLGRLTVTSVLKSMPGIGPVRARALMDRFEISEGRRLGGLGDRQRRALLEHFGLA